MNTCTDCGEMIPKNSGDELCPSCRAAQDELENSLSDYMTEIEKRIAILEAQNKILLESVETAIMWLRGNDMHIKAEQLNKVLKSLQVGESK